VPQEERKKYGRCEMLHKSKPQKGKGELASSFLGVFGGDKEEENGAVK
jgi:hypothetical protein